MLGGQSANTGSNATVNAVPNSWERRTTSAELTFLLTAPPKKSAAPYAAAAARARTSARTHLQGSCTNGSVVYPSRLVKVLVVDDLPDARFILKKRLERERVFDVVGEAANGQEAIDLCEQLSPDVVIMDFRMPVMDGLEATREIKDRFPSIEVIGFTAYEDPNMREAMISAGAIGNVTKTDLPELITLLHERADSA